MNTGTGVASILLTLGALLVSAGNVKTAEARSSYTNLHALKVPSTAPTASAVPSAPVVETTSSRHQADADAPAGAERITPPHPLENRGLRRMQKGEISPAMLEMAAHIVHKHYAKPVGTEVTVEVEGKQVIARIERHFHPEGGPVKPWGFHPGVSLFIAR